MSEPNLTENKDMSPNAQLAGLLASSSQARGFIQDGATESFQTSLEEGSVTSEQWRKLASAKAKASNNVSTHAEPTPSEAAAGDDQSKSRSDAERER